MRSRSLIVGLFFTLFFLVIISRVYWVQIVEASWLREDAQKKWQEDDILPAKRGVILDRNGKSLAEDNTAYIVSVSPKILTAKKLEREAAQGLAKVLTASGDPSETAKLEERIYEMATRKKKDSNGNETGVLLSDVEIRKEGYKIDAETKQKVEDFVKELQEKIELRNKQSEEKVDSKNVGIFLKETQSRYYPFNRLASHILGYIDKDGKPFYGLESFMNDTLEGTPGKLIRERDRKGVELPDGKSTYIPPENGKHIRLTIDHNIQFYLENALQKSYDRWHPRSMSAIAVDPKTMEILGMANVPDFNPNRYWETKDISAFTNKAISTAFEPGSTFKLVGLAGSVQEGLFNPNDTYQSGTIKVADRTLHDHNITGWGRISYMEGLLRSSNVAFVKLGLEKLGQDRFRNYIDAFGFGAKTGIDLPQEAAGSIPMRYPTEYATATYGQGLTVTAIQEAMAYAAIANGGKLMKPYLVKEIIDPQTHEVIQTNQPQVLRQVVSEETAKQTALDLEQVVANQEFGTGRRAYIEGYRVAGKTGTANIVLPGEKGYAVGKWLVSFVGFAPVEDPRILVAIIADVPDLKGDYHGGGEVAPPLFKDIVTQSLSYLGVSSSPGSEKIARYESSVAVPDVSGLAPSAAKTTLGQSGLKAEVLGKGSAVVKQIPQAGTEISLAQRVYLLTQEDEAATVPNLKGKSLRDAMEISSLLNIKCKANGEGYVVSQSLSGDQDHRELTLELKPAGEGGNPSDDSDQAAGVAPQNQQPQQPQQQQSQSQRNASKPAQASTPPAGSANGSASGKKQQPAGTAGGSDKKASP